MKSTKRVLFLVALLGIPGTGAAQSTGHLSIGIGLGEQTHPAYWSGFGVGAAHHSARSGTYLGFGFSAGLRLSDYDDGYGYGYGHHGGWLHWDDPWDCWYYEWYDPWYGCRSYYGTGFFGPWWGWHRPIFGFYGYFGWPSYRVVHHHWYGFSPFWHGGWGWYPDRDSPGLPVGRPGDAARLHRRPHRPRLAPLRSPLQGGSPGDPRHRNGRGCDEKDADPDSQAESDTLDASEAENPSRDHDAGPADAHPQSNAQGEADNPPADDARGTPARHQATRVHGAHVPNPRADHESTAQHLAATHDQGAPDTRQTVSAQGSPGAVQAASGKGQGVGSQARAQAQGVGPEASPAQAQGTAALAALRWLEEAPPEARRQGLTERVATSSEPQLHPADVKWSLQNVKAACHF